MVVMRVRVDAAQCGCTGYCVRLVPEMFTLPASGPAHAADRDVPRDLVDAVREAADLCPTQAIEIDE